MNDRIEKLAEQATETVSCGLNGTSTVESFNRKKFAELIVQECANQVDWILAEGGKTQGNLIREHFGVEK